MAPPAPLARSLGLGADPPGSTPPAGCRRPAALPGAGRRSPPTPEGAPGTQRGGLPAEVAPGDWTAVARGLPSRRCPLIWWMVTLLLPASGGSNQQRDFSLVVTEALKPHRGTSLELHGQEVREETGLSKQKKGSTEVRRLARCGGAAGVVNQAVANQRTATSQHQGHTAPQAALPAPAPMPPPPQPSAIARAPPSPPEPQQAAFRLTPHAVQTPPQTQEPRGGFSPDADTPLRNERHSRQHRLPAEKMEPPASHVTL
ncbi:hypothetical protein R6Z07F_016083 [Ovis aries]